MNGKMLLLFTPFQLTKDFIGTVYFRVVGETCILLMSFKNVLYRRLISFPAYFSS